MKKGRELYSQCLVISRTTNLANEKNLRGPTGFETRVSRTNEGRVGNEREKTFGLKTLEQGGTVLNRQRGRLGWTTIFSTTNCDPSASRPNGSRRDLVSSVIVVGNIRRTVSSGHLGVSRHENGKRVDREKGGFWCRHSS